MIFSQYNHKFQKKLTKSEWFWSFQWFRSRSLYNLRCICMSSFTSGVPASFRWIARRPLPGRRWRCNETEWSL